jgi:putative tryptophan/tyrosine transport system substrate-binding protein
MDVRRLAVVVGLVVCAWAAPARATVVLLGSEHAADDKEAIDAARQVAPSFSFADVDSQDASEQLRHADVILAVGARALIMARAVTPDTPVVYALVPAAEALPGKSVTGVALEVPPYVTFAQWKQLRFDGQRVGFVYDKASPASVADVNKAASALGLTLVVRAVDRAKLDSAVDALAPNVDAMWVVGPLSPAAAAKWSGKVALLGSDEKATAAGALFSLAPDPRDIGRRAARLALGIAGRAPKERLPVPPPSTSPGALTINAATAQALGIDVPDPILKKARKIYK